MNADLEAVIKRKLADARAELKSVADILSSERAPVLCVVEGMVKAAMAVVELAAEHGAWAFE